MASFTLARATALATLFVLIFTTVSGHGFPTVPRMRGAMHSLRKIPNAMMDRNAKPDYCAHCRNCGGPAAVSSSGDPFTMFDPFKKARKGITLCGDVVGKTGHTKKGYFANSASMPYAATYAPGSVANFEYDVTANHKGFITFFLCDVGSRDGDVENSVAFFNKNCRELVREPHESCESGEDLTCGPIDKKFPTRFVVPCGPHKGEDLVFGGPNGKMAYRIPDVEMVDAVVVTYWMTANSCTTDDGFMQNYNYPKAWKGCGTAHPQMAKCGAMYPEEFFGCSDVSVTGGNTGGKTGAKTPYKATDPPRTVYQTLTETATTIEVSRTEAPYTVAPVYIKKPKTTDAPTTPAPVYTKKPKTTEAPTTPAPVYTKKPKTTEAPTTPAPVYTKKPKTTDDPTTSKFLKKYARVVGCGMSCTSDGSSGQKCSSRSICHNGKCVGRDCCSWGTPFSMDTMSCAEPGAKPATKAPTTTVYAPATEGPTTTVYVPPISVDPTEAPTKAPPTYYTPPTTKPTTAVTYPSPKMKAGEKAEMVKKMVKKVTEVLVEEKAEGSVNVAKVTQCFSTCLKKKYQM